MSIICVECRKITKIKDTRGCYIHPYCKKCFKKVWNNDYDAYGRFLKKTYF